MRFLLVVIKEERKLKQILSVLFFFLFWVVTFRIVNAFVELFLQYSLLMDLFILLLTGVVSLALAKLAFDMLARQEQKNLPPKRRALIGTGLAILFASTFAFNYWNDHREKTVESALSGFSEAEDVTLYGSLFDKRKRLEKEEEIDQLINFISNVWIQITKDTLRINEKIYQVVNGPVDMQWLEQYYEQHMEEPG